MGEQLFANNARSSLAAGIGSADTSLSVQTGDGAKFPNPGSNEYFLATLQDINGNVEIVQVTSRATDSFTIVRAQEGTSAQAWSAGDTVELRITAGAMRPMETVPLVEQGSDPAPLSNWVKVFAKDVGGVSELFGIDSAGNVTQLTKAGAAVAHNGDDVDFNSIKQNGTGVALVPGTSINVSPGSGAPEIAYGTWRTPNVNYSTWLVCELRPATDGTSKGDMYLDVDESGGTTFDYEIGQTADPNLDLGRPNAMLISVPIPPGGSYVVYNTNDPNGTNYADVREFYF